MPDIFDYFKENEDKLQDLPSDKVWQKLEKRLEKRSLRKKRRIRFLQIGVTALAILILLIAALMVWYHYRKH